MVKLGFISYLNSVSRQVDIHQRKAFREQQKQVRQLEKEKNQRERIRIAQEKEQAIRYAQDKTREVEEKRREYTNLLNNYKPLSFSWKKLKYHPKIEKTKPKKPEYQELLEIPLLESFKPTLGILEMIFPSRKQKKIEESKKNFNEACRINQEENTKRKNTNNRLKEKYLKEFEKWKDERKIYFNYVSDLEKNLELNKKESVLFYFDKVLNSSYFPNEFEIDFESDYLEDTKTLIVDYQLFKISDIPVLKEMKYVINRKDFSETYLKEKDINKIYDEILYQTCLKVTYEIYLNDYVNSICSVVFNGWVSDVNKSTGNIESNCIMTLQTTKEEFKKLNISNLDAKSCFKKLKGIAGVELSSLSAVAPLLQINKADKRFTSSYDVANSINGQNLAVMDWEDFEHLIRELFSKEFSQNGVEVNVTRASRDGGVDAVVFDPDPLRGGKYVIQAKRYTNTVSVSAVRDLYGTVLNEGAVKGILVTTANYGPDAYSFAKDKPLTLLNGNNLLFMLQNHGYKARIDLNEAKK